MRWPGTYEELRQYLRDFANFGGESATYDTSSALGLLLALAENLRANAAEADLQAIAPQTISGEQASFFAALAHLAVRSRVAEPGDTGATPQPYAGASGELWPLAAGPAMQVLYDLPASPRETHLEERLLFLCKQDRRLLQRLVEHERRSQPYLPRADLLELAIEHFKRDNR